MTTATPGSPESRITRRRLLQAAALGVPILSALACLPRAGHRLSTDRPADVIVVGSGAGGLTAAITAHDLGCRVRVLEKADFVGGTSLFSGGWLTIFDNPLQRAIGVDDPKPDALALMARVFHPDRYAPDRPRLGLAEPEFRLIESLYDNGSRLIAGLLECGDLRLAIRTGWTGEPFQDDWAHLPENQAPDGRLIEAVTHDGAFGGGAELIAQLQAAAARRGIVVETERPVTGILVSHGGDVRGVHYQHRGETRAAPARQGVIFASGGLGHAPAELAASRPEHVYGACAVTTNQGDLIRILEGLDVDRPDDRSAWWVQNILDHALHNRNLRSHVFHVPGDSSILVNRLGDRVGNETGPYHTRTLMHFHRDLESGELVNRFLFLIYDGRTAQHFGGRYPIHRDAAESGLIVADNLTDLTTKLNQHLASLALWIGGFRLADRFADRLARTIAEYNTGAALGRDRFRRGETRNERLFFGRPPDPSGRPNPCLHPISDRGPYFARIVCAGMFDTRRGPRIDAHGRVLRRDGTPIHRLFAVGNAAATGLQNSISAGGTLWLSMILGDAAARHARTD